jgi:hypothetical protein
MLKFGYRNFGVSMVRQVSSVCIVDDSSILAHMKDT